MSDVSNNVKGHLPKLKIGSWWSHLEPEARYAEQVENPNFVEIVVLNSLDDGYCSLLGHIGNDFASEIIDRCITSGSATS